MIAKEDVLIGSDVFGNKLRYSIDNGYSWQDLDPTELSLRGEIGILEAALEKVENGPLPLQLLKAKLSEPNPGEKLVGGRW